jgi:nucleotide-binding universal stress UspA family protein
VLDLLVHCHDFEAFSSGPRYAAQLAAALNASLTGLYVVPRMPPLPPRNAPPSLTSEFLGFVHAEIERAEHAQGAFGRMAEGLGVRRWQWQLAVGQLTDCLCAAGNWNDLAVLEHRERVPKYCTETIAATVLSGVPCLVVRESAAAAAPALRRIAIAWNGSIEAIRAVHAALPVLRLARQIFMLASPPPAPSSRIVYEPEFSLERYLRQHGFAVQTVALSPHQRTPEDTILIEAANVDADLLVMGAFGSQRRYSSQYGGTTNYLIEQSTMPLFLRH